MTWRIENDGIRGLPKYHRVAPPESWPPNCSQNKTRKKLEVSKNSDRSDTTQHFSVLLKGWTITNEANKSVMAGRIRWHVMKCQAPDFAETFCPTAKGNSLTCNQKSMQPRVRKGIGWCGLRQMRLEPETSGESSNGTVRIRNQFTIGRYTTKHTKHTETCIACLIWQPAPWQFLDIAKVHPAI